jgi:hypothetical protein
MFPAPGFSPLKMEAIHSSETSGNAISTQRHIPEDDILHSNRGENLKSYEFTRVWTIHIDLVLHEFPLLLKI